MDYYKEMYLSLVNDVCDTIDKLRLALQKCEEIYVTQYEDTEEENNIFE